MDVCKCIVPSWHGVTLNSRRTTSLLMWLMEGEERWETPVHPQGFLPLNWGGTEQNRTVTCMVLKAKANDQRKNLTLSRDGFRRSCLLSIRRHKQQQQIKLLYETTFFIPSKNYEISKIFLVLSLNDRQSLPKCFITLRI
ncbi:uncharacterized protein TNCV_4668511 [Trichonephila clavipes]|nr:uncharacterized protein TNCV_4668511 [Trichonephila clavipes]